MRITHFISLATSVILATNAFGEDTFVDEYEPFGPIIPKNILLEYLKAAYRYTDKMTLNSYRFKGVVNTTNELPSNANFVDVYYVKASDASYGWIRKNAIGSGEWALIGGSTGIKPGEIESILGQYCNTNGNLIIGQNITFDKSPTNLIAYGVNIATSGTNTLVVGNNIVSSNDNSTVIGVGPVGSHGDGTVTISIPGTETSVGLEDLYINDERITDILGIHIGEISYKQQYKYGVPYGYPLICTNDCTVEIGVNAHAMETPSYNQSIAIGRDALSVGTATVAVGPNSFSEGSMGISLGWRANAIGNQSIAIGCAKKANIDYYINGHFNTTSDLAQAVGNGSIGIGYNVKANSDRNVSVGQLSKTLGSGAIAIGSEAQANGTDSITIGDRAATTNSNSIAIGHSAVANMSGAVQIGSGVNSTANSLQFQNVMIVKDGKICTDSTFDITRLDPKKIDVSSITNTEELTIKASSHIINTLVSTNKIGPGCELYIEPLESRNYTIYIPNTEAFREGFPITIDSEISGAEVLYTGDKKEIYKLPAYVKIEQPIETDVLVTITELKDKTDWTPVIETCNIDCQIVGGVTKFVTSGDKSLVGKNLHCGTTYKIVYPTTSGESTNDLMSVESGSTYMSGTFYSYTDSVEHTPTGMSFTSGKSWFSIIYKTLNGSATVLTKEVDLND